MTNTLTSSQKVFPKIGLALGSGAARGFCHVGVIKALQEADIPIFCVAGCSMGAIIGGAYAAGITTEKLEEVAVSIKSTVLSDFSLFGYKSGIVKGNKAFKIIKELVGDTLIEELQKPFAATATDIQKPALHTFTSGSLAEAIRASMAMPIIMRPFECSEGRRFVDGGLLERIPANACRALGADFVISVDAMPNPKEDVEVKHMFGMVRRILSISEWIANREKIKTECDFLITPEQGKRNLMIFRKNEESINAGYATAIESMPALLASIEKFTNTQPDFQI